MPIAVIVVVAAVVMASRPRRLVIRAVFCKVTRSRAKEAKVRLAAIVSTFSSSSFPQDGVCMHSSLDGIDHDCRRSDRRVWEQ